MIALFTQVSGEPGPAQSDPAHATATLSPSQFSVRMGAWRRDSELVAKPSLRFPTSSKSKVSG